MASPWQYVYKYNNELVGSRYNILVRKKALLHEETFASNPEKEEVLYVRLAVIFSQISSKWEGLF